MIKLRPMITGGKKKICIICKEKFIAYNPTALVCGSDKCYNALRRKERENNRRNKEKHILRI